MAKDFLTYYICLYGLSVDLSLKKIWSLIIAPLNFGLSSSQKIYLIYFNANPLKMVKKCLIFHLKRLFWLLKHLNIFSNYFIQVEKQLDKRAKVNFKVYDGRIWETFTIYTLPNISRSKDNQTMNDRIKRKKYFSSKIMQKIK